MPFGRLAQGCYYRARRTWVVEGRGTTALSRRPADSPAPGLAGFRKLRHAATGSTAIVYEAEDETSGLPVALKLLRSDRMMPQHLQSFAAEFDLLLDLAGTPFPVARGYHLCASGQPYISMEWIRGRSLEHQSEALSWSQPTLHRMHSLAVALEALHSCGWLHMDFKPANVIFEEDQVNSNTDVRARIVDVGLMVKIGSSVHPRGTPGFMAPELLRAGPLTYKSDLFSLGCIYYRILTGTDPFVGSTLRDTLRAQVSGRYLSPEEITPSLPPPLIELIRSLLHPDPGGRPESAAEIARELRRVANLEAWQVGENQPSLIQSDLPRPWPPIERPETRAIETFLVEPTSLRFRLVHILAKPGLGRSSFARDLSNRLSKNGVRSTLLTASRTTSGSRRNQQAQWVKLILAGREVSSKASTDSADPIVLGEVLLQTAEVLIFDLGDTPPVWFREWFDRLMVGVTSTSIRHPTGRGPQCCVTLSGEEIEVRSNDRIGSHGFTLQPIPDELLFDYLMRREDRITTNTRQLDILKRLVVHSQGYPEVLEALQAAPNELQPTDKLHPDDSPLEILRHDLRERLSGLDNESRRVLGTLEHSSVPLDMETWGLASGVARGRLEALAQRLMRTGLVLNTASGFEVAFDDSFESGLIPTEQARRRLHAALAKGLRSSTHLASTDRWLAIAEHELGDRSCQANRSVLNAALRLLADHRISEAARILGQWFDTIGRDCRPTALWCKRLRIQLLWDLGDEEAFHEACDSLPFTDPVRQVMTARQAARSGLGDQAFSIVDSIHLKDLGRYMQSFVLASRAFIAQVVKGSTHYCAEAELALQSLPPRGMLNIKGVLLIRLVQAALWIDRVDTAQVASEKLRALANSTGSIDLHCRAALSRCALAKHRGEYDKAYDGARQAVQLARELGNANQIVATLSQLGASATEIGHWEEAIGAKKECIAIAKAIGNLSAAVNELRNLSFSRQIQGLYELAEETASEGVELARNIGDRAKLASVLPMLVISLGCMNRRRSAHEFAEEALELLNEDDDAFDRAIALDASARTTPPEPEDPDREINPDMAEDVHA
ncbi:MAG: protein kinase, partial [Candidatus Eisenbacteria bacterium]|nr:protein kinase [Candidatus Eisenbacteria bacterium]